MISRLHYITQELPDFTHPQLAELACKGGADWIQLRVKNKPYDEWLQIAREAKIICLKYGAKLIINDNVEIAKLVGAHGVHLGKDDMNVTEARKLLGANCIIGGSTNSSEEIAKQIAEGCDYIGMGPFRFTTTKENLNPVLGLDEITSLASRFANKIPMIAIGGIQLEDITPLLNAGMHGIAVSSAINLAQDKISATESIKRKIKEVKLQKESANP